MFLQLNQNVISDCHLIKLRILFLKMFRNNLKYKMRQSMTMSRNILVFEDKLHLSHKKQPAPSSKGYKLAGFF